MSAPIDHPYRYFVSFATPHGFGNTVVELALPVRDYSDITVITKLLPDSGTASGAPLVTNIVALPLVHQTRSTTPRRGMGAALAHLLRATD